MTHKMTHKMTHNWRLYVAVGLFLHLTSTVVCQHDAGLVADTKGPDVVESVCQRIQASSVFSDDRLFLRRLAYVETADGTDPATYRETYHGGIWQISEDMLAETQSSSARLVLFSYIQSIQKHWGLDWPSVTWRELRRPLVSALAARMYIEYQSRRGAGPIPLSVAGQAEFWTKHYHPGGDANHFLERTSKLNHEVDDCLPEPCVYGACQDLDNGFKCNCEPGYTGDLCETDIDDCNPDPCLYGTCQDLVNGFKCNCEAGYTGDRCETEIDECQPNPCVHGTCQDFDNGFKCSCEPGYTGDLCETDIDDCKPDPCVYGTCQDLVNGFKCICESGYTGDRCETDIDDCNPDPCVHGTCQDLVNGFKCICDTGYTGDLCETEIGGCESQPCVHGTCVDDGDGYKCKCSPGFTGKNCESEIVEGLSCYTCHKAETNGECNAETEVCKHNEQACETVVDYENGQVVEISKGCKNPTACTGHDHNVECTGNGDKCWYCCNNASLCNGYIPSYPALNKFQSDSARKVHIPGTCDTRPCLHGTCEPRGDDAYSCICDPGYTGTKCQITLKRRGWKQGRK